MYCVKFITVKQNKIRFIRQICKYISTESKFECRCQMCKITNHPILLQEYRQIHVQKQNWKQEDKISRQTEK